jgi:uncharacterized membrane protein
MNALIRYFVRGLVIVVPFALTIYVIYKTVTAVDRWIAQVVDLPFPGVGFLITIGSIIVVGALASNIVGRTFFQMTERIFTRAPFVKIVYSSVRDLIEAFVGDKRRFNQPVLVALTSDGAILSPGFITRDDLSFLGEKDRVAVYFPQSYNVAGNLIFVPAERVRRISVESSQLMTFIVSGGVSGF